MLSLLWRYTGFQRTFLLCLVLIVDLMLYVMSFCTGLRFRFYYHIKKLHYFVHLTNFLSPMIIKTPIISKVLWDTLQVYCSGNFVIIPKRQGVCYIRKAGQNCKSILTIKSILATIVDNVFIKKHIFFLFQKYTNCHVNYFQFFQNLQKTEISDKKIFLIYL